jgi:hypothetical protein
MLRDDTLRTIQSAIARGETAIPGPDELRAIETEARQLRARGVRDAFSRAFAWLAGQRHLVLPAGRIDVVRGH